MSNTQPYHAAPVSKDFVPGFPKKTMIVFFVASLCVAAAGHHYFVSEKERYTRDKSKELSAIVSLKKGQLETWRNERLSDANFIFRNDAIATEAHAVLQQAPARGRASAAPEWMKSMYRNQHYSVMALFDNSHRQYLSYPEPLINGTPAFGRLLDSACAKHEVVFSDLYVDAHGRPALSIIVPLAVHTSTARERIGIIVLQVDPMTTLYPMLQSWPVPSRSGELLLLRRAGAGAAYLNRLRFSDAMPASFIEPAGDTTLLAARAFRTQDGMIEGADYRGMQTIGVALPVEGTGWTLVAKSDADEIYLPLRQTGFFLRVIVILLTLIGAISILSVWRHRRGLYYRRSYMQEVERKSLVRQIEYLVKYANDIIIVSDESLAIVDANDRAVDAYGYSREELLTRTTESLRPARHHGLEQSCARLILEQGSALYEAEHVRKDGSRLYVEVSGRVIEIEGKTYFQSVIRDITERKLAETALRESEERFRTLVDSLDEIVYTLGPDHRVLSAYGNWIERSGVHASSLAGKTVAELFGPEGYEYHRQMEDRALRGEHVLFESTYLELPGRTLHDVQTSLSPLRDQSDAIIGVVGIGRDITKMKRLERDLLQSQKMDSLGKLAGGIAHDFNNLLAMLMGSAELLKRNLKADPLNSVHIQRILEATERGSSIAKRLLLFSRQDVVQFQPVPVSHILNEVSEMLRYSFPKTITVIVDIQAGNDIVNGDAGHLHQAFVNLALNAKDAMGDEGTLTLAERNVDAAELREKFPQTFEGTYVAVSITDTGTGIDPAIRGKIFEPFYTTKVNGKGTGLGLSIVDGIVRSHHGVMDVASEPGRGTTFTLFLPAFAGSVDRSEPKLDEARGNGERILVVDDEIFIRDLLGEHLQDAGYEVLLASDGVEALRIYEKERNTIDIVITDLGMPKMSGEELFDRLRKITPTAAVIISSGYLDGTTRAQLMAKGVVDVITKPYRLDDILSLLHHHFRERHGRSSQ